MKLSPQDLMKLALKQAVLGGRLVRPNPQVGAALQLPSGDIFLGYHQKYGEAHAEINALKACQLAGKNPQGGVMAVTLEPCSHFGKTPPCADALIQAGLQEVYVGVRDPNIKVAGQGIAKLSKAGVTVVENILSEECRMVNRAWLRSHELGRSFVSLKMATSIDGLWSSQNGESKWITSSHSREMSHLLRRKVDVIATSRKTIESDNPQLTARHQGQVCPATEQPQVFVLTHKKDFSIEGYELSKHPKPVVVCEIQRDEDILSFLESCHRQGLHHVMVEAGPRLNSKFMDLGFWDEVWLFVGARFLGGNGKHLSVFNDGAIAGLEVKLRSVEHVTNSDDVLLIYERK